MNDWLDDFEMFGAKLNEGEKTLMRFAIGKEQKRIIELWREFMGDADADQLAQLIKGENIA